MVNLEYLLTDKKRDMKTQIKKLLPWLCAILVVISIAATSKQLMGPASSVVNNSIVKFRGTSGWQTTNSGVIIDANNNISGVSTQTSGALNVSIGTVTNGIQYLQRDTAPTAADVGGSVGVSTNYFVRNVNGQLISYWSDGTTLYSKVLAP